MKLDFKNIKQERMLWCWAATAANVHNYYENADRIQQCMIACKQLSRRDCCGAGMCNVRSLLHETLQYNGNLNNFFGGRIPFNQFKSILDDGKIVCGRIGWDNSDGHFLAIYGYEEKRSGNYLWVGDPYYRTSLIRYDMVMDNYLHQGKWTTTYISKPHKISTIRDAPISDGDLISRAQRFGNRIRSLSYIQQQNTASRHTVFVADLSDLKAENIVPQKVAVRFVNSEVEGQSVVIEFRAGNWPGRLLQILPSETFNESYRQTLAIAWELMQEGNSTLRLFCQTNMKVEAFWVHNNRNDSADRFVPIFSSSNFDANVEYTAGQFYETLIGAVIDYPTIDDELIGG